MKLITKTRVRRALIPLAALAVAAAIVPTAGAAECAMKPGANCAGMDLRGHNMNGMDLHGMNLAGANMSGMTLTGANMSGANMKGADMRGMTMRKMTMKGADMSKANLTGSTVIGGNWSKAKMMHTKLGGIAVSNANMSHVDFSHASNKVVRGANPTTRLMPSTRAAASSWGFFSGVDFSYTNWTNVSIEKAVFADRTNFHWAQMINSDFSSSEWVDALYVETFGMKNSNMSNTRLLGNTFAPAFAVYMNFDNMTCSYTNVPADSQVIGTVQSDDNSKVHMNGQNAQGTGQLSYGYYTLVTPTYAWWKTYGLLDLNGAERYTLPVTTSAANVTQWPGGCTIVGVNAL
ncbi:MAG: pentapeptide repeat-containing protein [Thermoleophilia bacterium]